MTTETRRRPWWVVNAIFDPDGGGADFSYTEGLAARGHPEIHVWARPTDGLDPGGDWHFSQRDTCVLLNDLAWRLVDGTLQVGDRWEQTYDGGLVTVRFELGEPVESSSVEAFGAGEAPVLPVTWSLERPPVAPPRALSPTRSAALRGEYDALRERLPPRVPAPPGWALPRRFSTDPEQRFGPRHAMVLGRAAQLFSGDASFWYRLMDSALLQQEQAPSGHAIARARAAARGAGRHDAVRRLEEAVHDLRTGLGVTWGVAEMPAALGSFLEGPAASDVELRTNLLLLVGDCIESLLVVEAVADVVSDDVVTLGQGAVRTSQRTDGRAPGHRWMAPRDIQERVLTLLAGLGSTEMAWCAVRWEGESGTSAARALAARTMLGSNHGPVIDLHVEGATVFGPRDLVLLEQRLQEKAQHWANDLAAVLVHRDVLPAAVVDDFCRASGVPAWLAAELKGGCD